MTCAFVCFSVCIHRWMDFLSVSVTVSLSLSLFSLSVSVLHNNEVNEQDIFK